MGDSGKGEKKRNKRESLFEDLKEGEPDFNDAEYPDGNTSTDSNQTLESKKEEIWKRFRKLDTYLLTPEDPASQSERTHNEACESFANVFLCNARLYHLAEFYMVPTLKPVCLKKLHKALLDFRLYQGRSSVVVELISYVYEKIPKRKDSVNSYLSIHHLVSLYAASKVEFLSRNPAFESLVARHGDFATDPTKEMVERLT